MWKTDRRDFLVAFATCMIIAFNSITYGILAGVIVQAVSSYTRGFGLRSHIEALTLTGKPGSGDPLSWQPKEAEFNSGPMIVVEGSPATSSPAPPPVAVVLRFIGPDLQFAHAERVHSHLGEAQGVFSPHALIIDCGSLASVDYTGARALLHAAEDVERGIAAELVGDIDAGPKPRCLVLFTNVSEDGEGALGPFFRRCGAALGSTVRIDAVAPLREAPGRLTPLWTIGSIACYRTIPEALEAAAKQLSPPRIEAPLPSTVSLSILPTVESSDGLSPCPVEKDDEVSVPLNVGDRSAGAQASPLPKPADAVEGIPLSPLLTYWLQRRRTAQAASTDSVPESAPTGTANASFWQRLLLRIQGYTLRSIARDTWSSVKGTWAFYHGIVGDIDPTAPLILQVNVGSVSAPSIQGSVLNPPTLATDPRRAALPVSPLLGNKTSNSSGFVRESGSQAALFLEPACHTFSS